MTLNEFIDKMTNLKIRQENVFKISNANVEFRLYGDYGSYDIIKFDSIVLFDLDKVIIKLKG